MSRRQQKRTDLYCIEIRQEGRSLRENHQIMHHSNEALGRWIVTCMWTLMKGYLTVACISLRDRGTSCDIDHHAHAVRYCLQTVFFEREY